MSKINEERYYYKINIQSNDLLISSRTNLELTHDDAIKYAHIQQNLLFKDESFKPLPYQIYPLATKENWDAGVINFCPRCGERMETESNQVRAFECFECEAVHWIQTNVYKEDEEEADDY